jgi:hypothetical protein
MGTLRPLSLAAICSVVIATAAPAGAAAGPAPAPTPVTVATTPIATGAGNQTDPHVSSRFLTYTSAVDATSTIHYRDVVTGATATVPHDGHRDSLASVSGSTIVFRRVRTDDARRQIMAFDATSPDVPPRELAPDAAARRASPEIGGPTVAWMQFVHGSSIETEIGVYDLVTGALTQLTDDAVKSNRDPAVSAAGTAVAWSKCDPDGTSCDVWQSVRDASGAWRTPRQLTGGSGVEDILPDTNGQQVVFASNASGDWDIHWMNVDGTGERTLIMPGTQSRPSLAGGLVSFEHESEGSTDADIFVFDLATEELYQVTDTPTVDDLLNDIAVAPDGSVLVTAASTDGLNFGDRDVYLHSFRLPSAGPAYSVCPLFETTKAHRAGSTVPLRLQLCDASGANLSSPSLNLTATGLVKKDSTASTALAEDAGNANPDSAFRYDSQLRGYVYNLSTRGLSRGTWELRFKVTADWATYAIPFDIR